MNDLTFAVRAAASVALLTLAAPPQAPAPRAVSEPQAAATPADPITEDRVRETVTWLAADERGGRDTGSDELAAAAQWITERFAAAGLVQVHEGSWAHEFPLPGWLLDQAALQVTLVRKEGDAERQFELAADVDVRQWAVAETLRGVDERATVGGIDDPALQRMLQAGVARRPLVCELPDDHTFWRQAAGQRRVLGTVRKGSRPVLLVRAGVLPPPPADDREVQWTMRWSAPAPERVDVPQQNPMALVRGTTKPDEYVVVSAHYDHVGRGREVDGDAIYNGADDNATGTTAVLLLAEALARAPLARSVLFVCFTGEERGLLGSKAFCADPPIPLANIVANVNLEMLGRPEPGAGGKAWITGGDLSDFAAIATRAMARADVGVVDFKLASQLFAASDNWSFAQHGVVAHSISGGSLHADYHQPGDHADKLDVVHMTQIVRALRELVLELANGDARPQWNERGRQRLQRAGR